MVVQTPAGESEWHRWVVRASWDGAVGVMLVAVPDREDESLTETAFFESAVRPLVGAAVELVAAVGGFGRAHLVFQTIARGCSLWAEGGAGRRELNMANGPEPVRDWTQDDGQLSEEAFGRIRRQYLRKLGVKAWEPEGDAD